MAGETEGCQWRWIRCVEIKGGKGECVGGGEKMGELRIKFDEICLLYCLTVREFLISHRALSECSDTSTLMTHAALPRGWAAEWSEHFPLTVMTKPPHTIRQIFTGFGNCCIPIKFPWLLLYQLICLVPRIWFYGLTVNPKRRVVHNADGEQY